MTRGIVRQQHSLLQTKLYTPPIRPELISRPRLMERLDAGLSEDGFARKLTLVSALAGFGKTTLISEWVYKVGVHGGAPPHVAWLSLDEGDSDPPRFQAYLLAALQTIEARIGQGILSVLQSLQPLPAEAILTSLINEMARIPGPMILVLDDYHLIETGAIQDYVACLLEH